MEKKQRYQGRYDASVVKRAQKQAAKEAAAAEKAARSGSTVKASSAPKQSAARPAAAKSTAKKSKKRSPALVILAVVAALIVAAGVGTYAYCAPALKYDTIYPNVYVAGVNVGGMSKLDAKAAVEKALDGTYGSETMIVELPDQTIEFPPELVSVNLDTDTAVDQAWRYGRSGNVLERAKALRNARKQEYRIDLKSDMELDTDAIEAKVRAAASKLDPNPVQTKLDLDTDNNLLTVTMGQAGRTLNVADLTEKVHQRFLDGDFSTLQYSYQTVAPDAVNLQAIYDQIGKSAEDAYFDEETGEIVPEVNGYGFDVAAAQQRVAMAKDGEVLKVELQVIEPETTKAELDALYFRDVLSQYDSPYPWNPNRTTNLTLAANAINGTVVMPGKEFSFNKVVGERTPEKGYKEATVYVQGASVGETGGGVCQVASTIYYCSLMADLEIVEREEHMYAVDYVPHGMDATIYWGQHDYRFRNNTEYPIRLETSVSDGYVHVKFIGTKTDNKKVVMTSELLSTTAWKTVDEQGRELVLATDKGEGVYKCTADGKYYKLVEVLETAYTGYNYYTYRNVYDGDTLVSTTKEDRTDYMKRDRKLRVTPLEETTEPQPGVIELPPVPGLDDPDPNQPDPGVQEPTNPDPGYVYPGTDTPEPDPYDPDPEEDEYWP